MNPYIGKTLGNYRLIEQIGQGGMATVFKAYQPSMDRYVAVKILPSHFTQDATFVARFTQEARVLARLEHPHILPVYDYGEQEGITYLVMRYIEAGTLHDLIAQQGTLSLREITRLMGQVGRALGYAHDQGVIHRDIKPSNVLIDPQGNAFLTDFGIAKIVAGTANFTGTGAVIGTPAYMAPEQGLGKPLDARCDIYALGVMLYEMVTGQVPFDAETPLAVMMKHVYDPLPLPRFFRPDIPEVIERVILKALAKMPEDRFQTALEMVETLERAVDGLPTEVVLPPIPGGPTAVIPTPPPSPPAEVPAVSARVPTPVPPSPSSPAPEATTEPVPERKKRPFPWLPVVGGVVGLIILVVAAIVLWPTLRPGEDEEPFVTTPEVPQALEGAATPVPALFSTELMLDNLDAACAVEVGQWDTCDDGDCGGASHDEDFLYAEPGCVDCRVSCNFIIAKGGLYDIWAWWPRGEDRATDTPHTLVSADGETVVNVNQRDQGNAWYPLATLSLAADSKFSIIVGGSDTGYANLDAVRLTPATGWRSFVNNNILYAVAVQGDYVWGGGPGGLMRWDILYETYDIFTTADGLPSNVINELLVDDDDRLWVGTASGIAVFDGNVWSTFGKSDGIEPAWTRTLFKDATGGIWAAVLYADPALMYYDGTEWRAAPAEPLPVSSPRPRGLLSDEDAGLFVAVEEQGLFHFNGDAWRLYTQEEGLPGNYVSALQLAEDGDALYFTFWKGAGRMDVQRGTFASLSRLSDVELHTVYKTRDDRVWFGGEGVFAYDPDDNEWTVFTADAYPELSWPVIDITEDDDALWFATVGGLLRYDGDVWQTWALPATLAHNHVRAIVQEDDGALWFAHTDAGLTRYAAGQGTWQAFGEAEGVSNGPSFPGVDSTGRVWIGYYGELRWYDGGGWRIMKPAALDGVTVYGITFAPDDIMWVWGYDKLLRYDSQADSWTTFTATDHPLLAKKFNAFYVAPDGTLWVAGKGGLAHYDGSDWTTETLDNANAEVDAVGGTPDGDVWAASGGDLYHRTVDGWERYDWASDWVRGLQGAADGTVWAWGNNLGHFNPEDGTWQTFTTADGLLPSDIECVWVTLEGVVWVGTVRGVSRYVP
ncbi:MAG: protein kinase [Anaerolineae bacterium]|nr:protein kinase [Anaerolineae bacterium]